MARFGTFTVAEVESFLQAYDEMLNRNKQLSQSAPVANLTQAYYPSFDKGGGRRSRGNGRGGHAAINCYYRYDQQYTQQSSSQNSNQAVPYANSTPPPPPSSFHQPKAFITAPPQATDTAWYPDSGASHHVTPDPSSFLSTQNNTNNTKHLLVGYTRPPYPGNI
ncbi:hypothetical protein PIB30_022561 [Stylosanthes scabra]|uniref:Uncharacterized protein n=1 Tax=Stylosanthes scabra TaxID=79078 RepID=A0ABU6Y7E1_9FABA|nr:hypothetical protein [Stylosanthes scabra]